MNDARDWKSKSVSESDTEQGKDMEDKKYVSFLNSDMCLGIIQAVQMQKKCYDEFLKITNSPEEAKEQTLIFMTAFWRTGNKKNESDESLK